MLRNRSHGSVIQSAIDLKSWIARTPTVAEARPAVCLGCKAASCPVGGRIQLHGHGVRQRQVRGPPGPGEDAAVALITGRRYRCVPCGAVFLVVPREVLPRRQYSAAAIGLALALWGLVQATALAVRLRVSPATALGFDAMAGWVTLRRWAKAVKQRRRRSRRARIPRRGTCRSSSARSSALRTRREGERGNEAETSAHLNGPLPRREAIRDKGPPPKRRKEDLRNGPERPETERARRADRDLSRDDPRPRHAPRARPRAA